MNKKSNFLLVLVIANLFLSQAMAQSVTVNKDIKNFNKVSLNSAAKLLLKQGSKYSVKIKADQRILPDLIVYKSGDTLNLGLKENDYRDKTVTFYVTMPNIIAIKDNNSGVVNVLTAIKEKTLVLSLHNSSHIMTTKNIVVDGDTAVTLANSGAISLGNLKTKNLNLKLANSGNIKINTLLAVGLTSSIKNSGTISIAGGSVHHQNLGIYNSGTFKASNLKSKTAQITMKNSGSIYAHVSDAISVDLSDGGDLHLYGKPRINHIAISGSGRIRSES